MSILKLQHTKKEAIVGSLQLNGSKSISNRVLIMQALAGKLSPIKNLSEARDTQALLRLLRQERAPILDAGDAGTTYRFLTAYLACRPGRQFLTGSKRMLERPIAVLVDALRKLGANISYAAKEGYPPLQIDEARFDSANRPILSVDAGISSQYISALLMIAPLLPQGLQLGLKGEWVSEPYIEMTLSLMKQYGIEHERKGDDFCISAQQYYPVEIAVESDWSAASYFYALAALSPIPFDINLSNFFNPSVQGDARIVDLMRPLGVDTEFLTNGRLRIFKKEGQPLPKEFYYDFRPCPDLAQTMAVVLAALQIPSHLEGLSTLRIKETDRISALEEELSKLGVELKTYPDAIEIKKGIPFDQISSSPIVKTYQDHRMAMSFAPLVQRLGQLKIEDPDVVNKSYPRFWQDLASLGFVVK